MSNAQWGRIASSAGMTGATVIVLASIVAAVAYTGTNGQTYSPLNHWISELGQVSVSELAAVFNMGLVIGGLLFVVFVVGLVVVRSGTLRYLYGAAGIGAGIAGIGVGTFPMDNLDMHGLAALTFFNLGWIFVGLASIDFWRRPEARFPRWLAIIGALTVAAFIGFLLVLAPLLGGEGLAAPEVRPDVWIVPILEWAVLLGILGWVFATSWTWWRAAPRQVATA
jgi:hypothetical membrane protein